MPRHNHPVAHIPLAQRRGVRGALTVILVVLLAAGLGTAGALGGPSMLHRFGMGRPASRAPDLTPPRLAIGPLSPDAPIPSAAGLSSALGGLVAVPQLGTATGVVLDPVSGRALWSRNPAKALVPGSTGKLLTAAAALLALDPAARLTTRVVAGAAPDEVVIVGGGDPTLSTLPVGTDSVYPGAAKLDVLAAAVRTAHPGPIRSVGYDLGRYSGAVLAPGWQPADVPGGYIAPIEPLTLDGGRSKPEEIDPPRSATPGLDAAKALAQRLGADPATVRERGAPAGAAVLAEVRSPSIADLVANALRISDNVLAEALAREVALAKGVEPSFAGASRAVLATLGGAGFDVSGVRMVDGSGLSTEDEVSAALLGQIMAAAAGPGNQPRSARLRPLLDGLPVAGGDGTLDDRFVTGSSAPGRGYVRAKTGTLTGVSSLAGTVIDVDGRLLAFALMSNGTSPADSRPQLDAIAAALRTCGCR
ncbi:MAG: D-alanyl-D-alanine carboxypeptidase/D-alanyl-D-alanine-endopeptidase [Pseudonocardia sp.]|nr:D-alanyl-D-alanine carboxypeptidase/D-alanyl-D-alanine-endopeptidase [Pseudonocardia sp.]